MKLLARSDHGSSVSYRAYFSYRDRAMTVGCPASGKSVRANIACSTTWDQHRDRAIGRSPCTDDLPRALEQLQGASVSSVKPPKFLDVTICTWLLGLSADQKKVTGKHKPRVA